MSITWIASFDIGKKNFSFYIEEFDSNIIKSLKNISFGMVNPFLEKN